MSAIFNTETMFGLISLLVGIATSILKVRLAGLTNLLIKVTRAFISRFKSGNFTFTASPILMWLMYVSGTLAVALRLPKLTMLANGIPGAAISPVFAITRSTAPLIGAYTLYISTWVLSNSKFLSNDSLLFLACKYWISVPIFWSQRLFCFSKTVLANSICCFKAAIWSRKIALSILANNCPAFTVCPSFTYTEVYVPAIRGVAVAVFLVSTVPWISIKLLKLRACNASVITGKTFSAAFILGSAAFISASSLAIFSVKAFDSAFNFDNASFFSAKVLGCFSPPQDVTRNVAVNKNTMYCAFIIVWFLTSSFPLLFCWEESNQALSQKSLKDVPQCGEVD